MIVYDLRCGGGHVFEAWFKNSAAYDALAAAGHVACPHCGDTQVAKAPMAPNIATQKAAAPIPATTTPAMPSQAAAKTAVMGTPMADHMRRFLQEMRQHVEQNFDYVGKEFAEEARKIHYGEADPRPIYGEATANESAALREEGVEFLEIPLPRKVDG